MSDVSTSPDRNGPATTAEPLVNEAENRRKRANLAPLARLLPFLKRYKLKVLAAIAALFAAAGATLVLPSAIRQMIDQGFDSDNSQLIQSYFLVLIAVVAALSVASALRYFLVMWIGERVVADLRRAAFDHIVGLDASFYDGARSGEILSRLTADTTQIKSAFGASASIAMRNLIMSFGATVMMVITSPHLSLIVLAAIPVILVPLLTFARGVRKRSRTAQDTLANAIAYASEILSNIRSLQAFTHERHASERFGSAVEESFSAARRMTAARAILTAFAIFVIGCSVVIVLWIGANRVMAGTMTGGELSQFLLYSVLAAGSLAGLSEVWGELSLAAGAAERLSELLDIEPSITAPQNAQSVPHSNAVELGFKNVSFAYEAANALPALTDISLKVRPGETVALVGPSGAGKSTLFHLLLRYYDPTSGALTLNGTDLRQLDPRELRTHMALVPQETAIFAATIADNIAFSKPEASREEIIVAAKAASAHDFISAMTEGYDTLVGERGITLSGGQKQRLAIARAILKDAPILLLDEATSALDAESERAVQDALDELMQDRTTLVIAHRLATVLKADRIIVLESGRILEEGTHQQLLAKGGLYANLARLQFDQPLA
ncbi:ABC transporter transmembrane domain-containing protein [Roseibium sp.]|uniref:ABC transporter transmembrane domain-containing protein n=1 Tax=Roseibium sp. TaxID=1936156 RepID=UPI003A981066